MYGYVRSGVFQEALANGVSSLSFGDLSANLGQTMYQYKFQIPAYYTLLVRSLTVLEGIALASDPNYKVLSAAYPWVARRLLTDSSIELRSTLKALLYKDGKFQFKRLVALLEQAVKSPAKDVYLQENGSAGEFFLPNVKLAGYFCLLGLYFGRNCWKESNVQIPQ